MEYFINNCNTVNQILIFNNYDSYRMKEYGYTYAQIKAEKEKACIEYLERNKRLYGKAITIGMRTNATSTMISEDFFKRLKVENLVDSNI